MFEAHFLDQGRVDAILLGAGGRWAFVDSGFRANGDKCVKYMRKLGITKLDCYIATHRHRNHVGGAPVIIREMTPDVVYTADGRMRERIEGLCGSKAEREAVKATPFVVLDPGDEISLGGAVLTRIGPRALKKCSAGALAENQNSLILKARYGERTMLLTGDTSASVLSGIDKALVRAEVLKNPHHNGALAADTLKRIAPEIVVICSNSRPSSSYQKRLKSIGAKWFTACKKGSGNVRLWTDADGWWVKMDGWRGETQA